MTGLLLLLALGLVICWTLVVAYTLWGLVHPPRKTYASALRRGIPGEPGELDEPREFEEWSFNSRGNTLTAWDIAGDNPPGPVCVFTHGWGNAKLDALVRLDPFVKHCSRIVAWDMPGHGESEGRSDLGVGEVDDLVALVDKIAPDAPIILFGWSLGSGVSIAAATKLEDKVRALVAEAPYRYAYTPAKNVVSQSAQPWRTTLRPGFAFMGLLRKRSPLWAGKWPQFDRAEFAKSLTCPLLVIHGSDDTVSPFTDGQEIAQAAPNSKLHTIKDGSHNTLWIEESWRESASEAVDSFLSGVLAEGSA
ncbi:MAG: alpha/beta hydrolase [Phycisphaera sp.]|nr:MAG: alpha/beta hydrolase [Phycisphaera sp.]